MISALRWANHVSHFNVSLIVQDKVMRPSVHKSRFLKRKGEPKRGVEPAFFRRLPAERLNHRAKPPHKKTGEEKSLWLKSCTKVVVTYHTQNGIQCKKQHKNMLMHAPRWITTKLARGETNKYWPLCSENGIAEDKINWNYIIFYYHY